MKRKKTKSKRERKRKIQAVQNPPDVKIIDSIQVKPSKPSKLVEAVREELVALVAMPDLAAHLGQIARFARQADDMLVVVKSPEAIMHDEHALLGATSTVTPLAASNGAETYGSSILRQLIPALQGYQKAQQETPEALVHAITLARRNGMTDVAAELEKKLTGKALDGERPVKADVFGIDTYLPPALGPAPTKGASNAVIFGNDPNECDGIYPRTSDGRCHGCGVVGEHPKKSAPKKNGKTATTSAS